MSVAPLVCSWDALVQTLGIADGDLAESKELQAWAKKHCASKFVPEYLLDAWHIKVKLNE